MKRMVKAAEDQDRESIFKDKLSSIEDDFTYLIDGLSHIDIDDAEAIADSINESIQSCIADVAGFLSE